MDKIKILIVDDEQDFLVLAASNLKKTDKYEVKILIKATQAVALALEFKPDLIFLDIVMPDIDGGEVARLIKDEVELEDIPIVFLSSLIRETRESPKEQYQYLDKQEFIKKLLHEDQLVECVDALLLHHRKKPS
ncbi:PleD family two-component system response regulator [Candidatus Omnitrophota bacterium]